MKIRKLTAADAAAWRQIRLEGLTKDPQAFLTQYCDEVDKPLEAFAKQLEASVTFAAFDSEEPVASFGYYMDDRTAVYHIATIIAVYIRAQYRGSGLADDLMNAVIGDLPERILQVHLYCAAENSRGVAFYQRHGFEICGTIPRAVLVDGVGSDEHVMVRRMDT